MPSQLCGLFQGDTLCEINEHKFFFLKHDQNLNLINSDIKLTISPCFEEEKRKETHFIRTQLGPNT